MSIIILHNAEFSCSAPFGAFVEQCSAAECTKEPKCALSAGTHCYAFGM